MGEKNKVVLLGDCGVGKTTLFTRFKSGIFVENMDKQKRAEAEHQKTITVDGEDITVGVVRIYCVAVCIHCSPTVEHTHRSTYVHNSSRQLVQICPSPLCFHKNTPLQNSQ